MKTLFAVLLLAVIGTATYFFSCTTKKSERKENLLIGNWKLDSLHADSNDFGGALVSMLFYSDSTTTHQYYFINDSTMYTLENDKYVDTSKYSRSGDQLLISERNGIDTAKIVLLDSTKLVLRHSNKTEMILSKITDQ